MHRGGPMRESFDHRPTGGIRQSRKCCTQLIHNHMVVDVMSMSSTNFAIPDCCSGVAGDRPLNRASDRPNHLALPHCQEAGWWRNGSGLRSGRYPLETTCCFEISPRQSGRKAKTKSAMALLIHRVEILKPQSNCREQVI